MHDNIESVSATVNLDKCRHCVMLALEMYSRY